MINLHTQKLNDWCKTLEAKFQKKYPNHPVNRNYKWKTNKRYTKIIEVTGTNESVHAFVDNDSLDVLKAATWNHPAKGKRYHLLEDYDRMIENCDPHGAYLYKGKTEKV